MSENQPTPTMIFATGIGMSAMLENTNGGKRMLNLLRMEKAAFMRVNHRTMEKAKGVTRAAAEHICLKNKEYNHIHPLHDELWTGIDEMIREAYLAKAWHDVTRAEGELLATLHRWGVKIEEPALESAR
jgi:hypothetical protein